MQQLTQSMQKIFEIISLVLKKYYTFAAEKK
jgi:hypothetical protein